MVYLKEEMALLLFSHSVVSDSLQPYGSQHARPPCPSPTIQNRPMLNKSHLYNHQLNGQEFEQTLGESERQGSLVCYSPWGHESMGTRLSNWTIRTTYMDVKVFQIDGGTNVEETMSKDPPKILKEWGEVLRTLLSNNSEKSRGPWTSRKKEHTDGDHRR